MPDSKPGFTDDGEAAPSKTRIKQQMLALQRLGEALAQLSDQQLSRIPLPSSQLEEAIREVRRITSNSARRRHLQFIGKLMRGIDPEPIATALAEMDRGHQETTDRFHTLEQLRDELLATGPAGIEPLLLRWPHAQRQRLRQLLRQHELELAHGKTSSASLKLFRYLRELQESSGEPGSGGGST